VHDQTAAGLPEGFGERPWPAAAFLGVKRERDLDENLGMSPHEHVGSLRPSSIAVIGSGYVGTVVAACLASLGHGVVAVESDPGRLAQLVDGRVPFTEPGLETVLRRAVNAGRLRFTADSADAVAASHVVFLCVGTPPGPGGHADTTALEVAATAIGRNLREPRVVVTKSTVPIGSGYWLASIIEDAYTGDRPVDEVLSVVSCPEFLREGNAVDDFLHPDRVVLGSDDPAALDVVAEVYRPVLDQAFPGGDRDRLPPLVRTGLLTAETVKYAANAFLAMKISFINEIANICEHVGADVSDVAAAIGLDPRIGRRFLFPGVGWGGSCFGKDLSELVSTAGDYGYDPLLLRAAIGVNERQRRIVVDKLRHHLGTLRGKRVCLLGLAFKPGTDDLRDAPAVDIARLLVAAGASVTAHDPVVPGVPAVPGLVVRGDPVAAALRADALVLVTEWPEYGALDLVALRSVMRGCTLIDGRNLLDPARARAAGFVYVGVGRRAAATAPAAREVVTAAVS
jgi:nucleotide sugar dehydrogenase